jgi:hypothetical protein
MIKELNMEKINLRKANALQSEIRKAISSSGIQDTLSITEFTTDIAGGLEKAKAEFATDVTRKVALNTALFNIRKSVAQANSTSGISDLLADVQTIDAVMTVYSGVATKTEAKSLAEIVARIEKMKAAAPTERSTLGLYGDRYNNVETGVVDKNTIDTAKQKVKELKREKQALQDKLLTLNVNTTITISDVDVMVLKTEGII